MSDRGRERRQLSRRPALGRSAKGSRLEAKPPCSDLSGIRGREWLAGLTLPLEERESVDAATRHIKFLDTEIAAVEKLIAQQRSPCLSSPR
jgi:hypothetical protein